MRYHVKVLFSELEKLLKGNKRIVISIDGMSGSGKSSLADQLKEKYNATIFHMDDYFLPNIKKTMNRLKMPGGNVDFERVYEEIFKKLDNDFIEINKFDCSDSSLTKHKVKLGNFIVVEGVYSMRIEFRKHYDLSVFFEIDEELQQQRILKRSGTKLLERFVNEWIPLENYYFKELKVKEAADIIYKINE